MHPNVAGEAVVNAINIGYRHIDCAAIYGNEKSIGDAISNFFEKNDKNIKREDIFFTSKLPVTHMNPIEVEDKCKQTLKDLQLEYLDLYLVHCQYQLDIILKLRNLKK